MHGYFLHCRNILTIQSGPQNIGKFFDKETDKPIEKEPDEPTNQLSRPYPISPTSACPWAKQGYKQIHNWIGQYQLAGAMEKLQ